MQASCQSVNDIRDILPVQTLGGTGRVIAMDTVAGHPRVELSLPVPTAQILLVKQKSDFRSRLYHEYLEEQSEQEQ